MALEDAVVLAACLGDAATPSSAFAQYESLRRARTRAVMLMARQNGARKLAGNRVSIFLRVLLLPLFVPLGLKEARRIAAFRVDRSPLSLPA